MGRHRFSIAEVSEINCSVGDLGLPADSLALFAPPRASKLLLKSIMHSLRNLFSHYLEGWFAKLVASGVKSYMLRLAELKNSVA